MATLFEATQLNNGKPIIINADKIIWLRPYLKHTQIMFSDDVEGMIVKESIDSISQLVEVSRYL